MRCEIAIFFLLSKTLFRHKVFLSLFLLGQESRVVCFYLSSFAPVGCRALGVTFFLSRFHLFLFHFYFTPSLFLFFFWWQHFQSGEFLLLTLSSSSFVIRCVTYSCDTMRVLCHVKRLDLRFELDFVFASKSERKSLFISVTKLKTQQNNLQN